MLFYKKTLISNSRLRFYSKWWWSRLSKVSNILVEILCKDSEKRALLLQNPFIFNEKQCRAPTSICHFSIHPSVCPSGTISGTIHYLILIFNTWVKWWYLQVVLKGKKRLKIKNENYIHHVLHLRTGIAYDHNFCYSSLKWRYL